MKSATRDTESATPYDYSEIQELRTQGKSWGDIGNYYDRHRANPYRWFIAERENRAREKKDLKRKAEPIRKSIRLSGIKQEAYYKEVPRIYGDLPPTSHVSTLSNDEWIRYYLGEGYEWDEPYLTEIREILWEEHPVDPSLILLPRDTGKTKSEIAIYVRWIVERQTPTLSITSGGASKRRTFRAVARYIKSKKIRQYYGDIIESFSTTTAEMWLKIDLTKGYTDPIFKVAGRMADMIGSHPVKLFLSDVIQEDFKSNESQEGLFQWHGDVVHHMTPNKCAIGTRRSKKDYYQFLLKQGFRKHHKYALVLLEGEWSDISDCTIETVEDGEEIYEYITDIKIRGKYAMLECPTFDLKKLLIERVMNYESFMSQRQNDPISRSGNYFSVKYWKEVPPYDDFYNTYIVVDPAFGESNMSSDSAIIVFGIRKGKIIIVDSAIGKLSTTQKALETIRLHKLYNPLQTIVEDNFRQMTTRYKVNSEFRTLKGIRFIDQFKNKLQRISAMLGSFERLEWEVLTTCSNRGRIKAQYLEYNQRKGSWDILDCMATAYEIVNPFMRRRSYGIPMQTTGKRF